MAKTHYKLDYLLDTIRCGLDELDIEVVKEVDIEYGFQITVVNKVYINVYTTGRIFVDGSNQPKYDIVKMISAIDKWKWLEKIETKQQ